MSAIKYKDPSTNLWEEVGEIIRGKDAAYVGASAPTDPQYTIWVDTSETGEGLVTSVNGQVGAVTVTIPTKVSDLQNDSAFVNAAGAAAAAPVQSVNGKSGAITAVLPIKPSELITSGTIASTGNMSYTATKNCWVFLNIYFHANSNATLVVKLNNVSIIDFASGEALSAQINFIPIPIKSGDTLYVSQSSNRASSYSIFAME